VPGVCTSSGKAVVDGAARLTYAQFFARCDRVALQAPGKKSCYGGRDAALAQPAGRGAVDRLSPARAVVAANWGDVQGDAAGVPHAFVLRAGKTMTGTLRDIPVGQRLAAVLDMLLTDSEGATLPHDAFVFGDDVGGPIASIKTAWRTACEKAGVVDLHFHDLRREFACQLLESRAELHNVRDFLVASVHRK
jgi:integrase